MWLSLESLRKCKRSPPTRRHPRQGRAERCLRCEDGNHGNGRCAEFLRVLRSMASLQPNEPLFQIVGTLWWFVPDMVVRADDDERRRADTAARK